VYALVKRLLDVVVSAVALAILSPVMFAIAVWIRWDAPGPILYTGRRAGKNGRLFNMLKYRSMVVNADQIGGASTSGEDTRITKPGRLIRKFKLDELPQLINVLKGEMSFIGPRPEVQQYVDIYTEEEAAILNVRPGITDWASIWNSDEGAVLAKYGDPDNAYEEVVRPGKLKLQLKYINECSFWTDVKIFVSTIRKLVQSDWLPRELDSYGRLV